MSDNNITVNTNQSPYFDDFDDDKNFHQVMYKPSLPVQARELTTQQTIHRDQMKKFGDHVFKNGSKVTGADITLNLDYEYVKLQTQLNGVDINVLNFAGKTIVGNESGTKALVLNSVIEDTAASEPNTLFVKYITGGSITDGVQGIKIDTPGTGYTSIPIVQIIDSLGLGTGATAVANVNNGAVTSVDMLTTGSNYTQAPTVQFVGGSGSGTIATSTIETKPAFLTNERVNTTDLSVSALTATSAPVGTGSSISIGEGVFYVNGNFIKISDETLILDKYANTPSYKIGVTAREEMVTSGDDNTLLDNAQGSFNFSAPGADRLKVSLTLTKKTLDSEDDTDFFEIFRVENGLKQLDVAVPLYSELEKTFARRTYDESGSYTVRPFNIQLKDDPNDSTKFIVRLDPGKAFIEGFEYETIISEDLTLDKPRTVVNVNNFDRLMQYGNYVKVTNYTGYYDITEQVRVDLHNVNSGAVDLTDPTTYASTKIGTARVRSVTYAAGAGASKIFNLYIFLEKMISDDFAAAESIVVPINDQATPVVLEASSDIDDTGKEGGVTNGAAKFFETTNNTLVFKLPQNTIQTIRDENGVIDTSYTTKRTFENVPFTAGVSTIASNGSTETMFGTGLLSNTNKIDNYLLTVTDVGTSGFSLGDVIDLDDPATAQVNGPSNTSVTFDCNVGSNFECAIVATMNIDSKQEKLKNLTLAVTETITTPNTANLGHDSLNVSDIYTLTAVYDSEAGGNVPILPTLVVASTADTLTPGETIVGTNSAATGQVVVGAGGTTEVTYIPLTGTFVAEDITGSLSGFVKTVGSVVTGSPNITSRYSLDNGQRDNFYEHGRIQLKDGETAPTGQITAVFNHFTHTGLGYFSVNSYTAAVGFDNVPTYTSPVTGDEVELRDCIDFRPRRIDGGTTMQNVEIPSPNTNWSADYSYYLPRIDTIYLSRERKFGSTKGIPSLTVVPPVRVDGTMNLYTLEIPAYTFKATDVNAKYIENKRYTMRDIGKLEKRVDNLEYYTSLSLLEAETESLVIKDSNGLDRFKNGILADSFRGHSVGNVLSLDYKCAIDFNEKILRPSFNSNLVDVIYDSGASTGVMKTGDLITLPYTTASFVDQPVASKSINVNPFAVLAWVGTVELSPPNDNWIDTDTQPEVVVNLQGENDAWSRLVGLGFGTQFNDWEDVGAGRNERQVGTAGTFTSGRAIIQRQTIRVDQRQSRTGIRSEITGTDTVRSSIGERITNVSIVPFIRSRDITINVTGMKPNTKVYAYFDGEPVSAYCTPSGGALADDIYTNSAGSISGLIFTIPNTDALRFRTGERQFLLTDNTNANLVTAGTYAEVVYQAQGLLQTKENVVVASRVPRLQQMGMGSATEFRTTTNTFTRNAVVGWFDPLAETFLVDESLYPDGVFISDIDLFFKTKDTDGLPVSLQIRDTLNGYPTQTILPFSDVSLTPDQVTISEDATSATKFTFPSLVYLQPGEYAIVVISNSIKYEAYISEMGENIIGTNRKVSEQPYAGVFFKSQNASTWSPDQNQDLTFKINRAVFTIDGTANAVFKDGTSASEYKADIINLVPQEVRINGTNVTWGIKMTTVENSVLDIDYSAVTQNYNYKLPVQKKVTTAAGSYVSQATLTSASNTSISPVIDCARNSIIVVENKINNLTTNEETMSEQMQEGGQAIARYLTRRVTLKDGFDATDLKIYMTANRQSGTNINCYYKVLSQYDADIFDDKYWVLMQEVTNTNTVSASDDDGEYLELEYAPSTANTSYIVSTVTYDSFKVFAIKIVMTSPTTTKVPLIKDLRCIALA